MTEVPRAGAAAAFLKKNASLFLLLLCLAAVLYLYFGIDRDARDRIRDGSEAYRGDSAGGLYVAYVGTFLIVAAQFYTLMRRLGIPDWARRLGGIPLWLNLHIALSLLGFLFVLVHAGFPFAFRADRLTQHALAGFATWLLLLEVVSGIFGRYLYRRLPTMKKAFAFWKPTHVFVTVLFFATVLYHILAA